MAQSTEQQMKMYGCLQADIDTDLAENAFSADALMLCMSILSDCQHVMANGTPSGIETARQWMNKTKYILSTIREKQMISLRNGELKTTPVGE